MKNFRNDSLCIAGHGRQQTAVRIFCTNNFAARTISCRLPLRFFCKNIVVYDKSGSSNTERICGLYDNITVIRDTDKGFKKYLFLIRLYFVIFRRKPNGKK
jgi:hypothetical protein